MTKNLTLNIEDLEDRIAPDLILPNGKEIFDNHNNPSPQFSCHPSLANGAMLHSDWHAVGPWSASADYTYDGPAEFDPSFVSFDQNGGPLTFDHTGTLNC